MSGLVDMFERVLRLLIRSGLEVLLIQYRLRLAGGEYKLLSLPPMSLCLTGKYTALLFIIGKTSSAVSGISSWKSGTASAKNHN